MKRFLRNLLITVLLSFVFWEGRWIWALLTTKGIQVWVENAKLEAAITAVEEDRLDRNCRGIPKVSK